MRFVTQQHDPFCIKNAYNRLNSDGLFVLSIDSARLFRQSIFNGGVLTALSVTGLPV
ncbi:MAG: hypothetical protein LBJ67_11740 [Planctomycetaceae bacterium]|jgi:hypothetical protein|nr:hypothetical protein [Planctomycetaceae bacterium]